ncbi:MULTISPECIES: DNA primase [Legionella]|uniref:DNA primase n=1 Tax=Legionella septentrionalis TaxID=2498109 RepID=A0A3S0VBU0_9GAMM|nr:MULTISPECIES: DNA primase [Legionella]MCP0914034.1 DNA primase [Legionella sp. 27cVA30]RUQ90803.1 DNA primase [Legionella septentrionalis]RUR09211.1 DNA primase [Legionella septentrionalis]RUR13927.1 DNA primase [Legionella septentrionalis]
MTGLIPRPFIDELLNRTDIIELIDSYVPLKKRGNSHLACCPFHNEKTPSFNVLAKKQFYHCFGCGASGNAISFIMNYLHLGFVETIETLALRVGMQVPREENHSHNKSSDLYQLLKQVAQFFQKQLKENQETISYLKKRGVSGEIARLYQLGYAPSGWHVLETQFKSRRNELIAAGMLVQKENGQTYDRYRHRVIFPIHDRHGRIIGFGGRILASEQQPKYLNSPETVIFQKNRELYGLHQIIQQKTVINHIVVVEGYMDVIALAEHGILNAVATLGTATSTFHIQLLSKHTKNIIFCFDGDAAGRKAAWRALESTLPSLNEGLAANFIFLPEGHDPDSLVRAEGKDKFLQRLQQAIPLNQYFFTTLTEDYDSTNLSSRTQLVNAAKPYLLKMPEGPYKEMMLDELARLTRIEHHRLTQLLEDKVSINLHDASVNMARSPLRLAVALLLQNPELYQAHSQELPPHLLDAPNQAILQTLMQQIAEHPGINTASLVEFWRDSNLFESMNKLAAWDHQVPEAALSKEFLDIMNFLIKQNRENKIQQLLEKSRTMSLTESDRLQLQDMLKERHKVN